VTSSRSSGGGNNRSAAISGVTSLVYVENQPSVLRCTALGGSPPPDIEVFVGQTDITNRLTLSRQPTTSRQRGLRLLYYTTERSTTQFVARASDDGQTLRCVVSVPGSPDNTSLARITVHCKIANYSHTSIRSNELISIARNRDPNMIVTPL
jgi:hypothetical protein